MNADQYLMTILRRERVDTSVAQAVLNTLRPIIVQWGNQYLAGIAPSGAFAKGTAIKSGTDIDLFISLKPETWETLKEIYHSLYQRMQAVGLSPNVQNVLDQCACWESQRGFGARKAAEQPGHGPPSVPTPEGYVDPNERLKTHSARSECQSAARDAYHQAMAEPEGSGFPVVLP
jgi:hypothetical protein